MGWETKKNDINDESDGGPLAPSAHGRLRRMSKRICDSYAEFTDEP